MKKCTNQFAKPASYFNPHLLLTVIVSSTIITVTQNSLLLQVQIQVKGMSDAQ